MHFCTAFGDEIAPCQNALISSSCVTTSPARWTRYTSTSVARGLRVADSFPRRGVRCVGSTSHSSMRYRAVTFGSFLFQREAIQKVFRRFFCCHQAYVDLGPPRQAALNRFTGERFMKPIVVGVRTADMARQPNFLMIRGMMDWTANVDFVIARSGS